MNQQENRLRVLLSEGSSNSARQAIYGLGRKYIIDVLDPSPWCQCRFSSLGRRRIACPWLAKDPLGYARFVAERVRDGGYEALFPTHEQVYVFSKFRDAFQRHVGLAVPSFQAISRVQSKAAARLSRSPPDFWTSQRWSRVPEGAVRFRWKAVRWVRPLRARQLVAGLSDAEQASLLPNSAPG